MPQIWRYDQTRIEANVEAVQILSWNQSALSTKVDIKESSIKSFIIFLIINGIGSFNRMTHLNEGKHMGQSLHDGNLLILISLFHICRLCLSSPSQWTIIHIVLASHSSSISFTYVLKVQTTKFLPCPLKGQLILKHQSESCLLRLQSKFFSS